MYVNFESLEVMRTKVQAVKTVRFSIRGNNSEEFPSILFLMTKHELTEMNNIIRRRKLLKSLYLDFSL